MDNEVSPRYCMSHYRIKNSHLYGTVRYLYVYDHSLQFCKEDQTSVQSTRMNAQALVGAGLCVLGWIKNFNIPVSCVQNGATVHWQQPALLCISLLFLSSHDC